MSADHATSRRSFCFIAGGIAAAAAPMAAAMAAKASPPAGNDLQGRLAALEDEQAVRALHRQLVRHINRGSEGADSGLFARAAAIGIDDAVRRVELDADDTALSFVRAPDGLSARMQAACDVTRERLMEGECMMVRMAIAQGEGVARQTDRQQLESSYVKVDGRWLVEGASLETV